MLYIAILFVIILGTVWEQKCALMSNDLYLLEGCKQHGNSACLSEPMAEFVFLWPARII